MDDFLHNLRTGKDKRYDRTRRNYDSPPYRSMDRQNGGMDRRKKGGYKQQNSDQAYMTISKVLPVLKTLLESITEDRKQATHLEERKTVALETIASCLKKMTGADADLAVVTAEMDAAEEAEAHETLSTDPAEDAQNGIGDAATMDVIKNLREEGFSFEKIAQQLDDKGIPTPSRRGKWRGQTVSKLLKA